jgi:hypothetical protein
MVDLVIQSLIEFIVEPVLGLAGKMWRRVRRSRTESPRP